MKAACCRKTHLYILIIAFTSILTTGLSAFDMRIDGSFEDWKDVKMLASDPEGDAKGAFDVTGVYATSRGSILYLRFDTGSLVNLQNGLKSEGTLLVVIDLPDNQKVTIDTRGRCAFLNDDIKEQIYLGQLNYVVGPTYAQDEFEIQIDLGRFGINVGDSVHIQFDGSDQLEDSVIYTFTEDWETPKRRSHHRHLGTDVRIVSLNTYYEGLSDPERADALGRLLNSVDGEVYCFQEEWQSKDPGETMKRLMPLEDGSQWYIHKIHGHSNVIVSKYPLKALPSKNNHYAAACIELKGKRLYVISVHLSAMGYIGSKEDIFRIRQANAIMETIGHINRGEYNDNDLTSKPGIVIAGDFNLVGSRTPLDLMTDKKDDGLKDWLVPNLIGESVITWRGGLKETFAPGKLDYVIYSNKTLEPQNGFVIDSELLNQNELKQLKLENTDSKVSDHLLITVDFKFSD
jgi:endonuclease/exonuclease/phosphatase family metal-dependent hydrolase